MLCSWMTIRGIRKYFFGFFALFLAVGLVVFSPFSSSVNAINIDLNEGGKFGFNTNGRLYARDGSFIGGSLWEEGGQVALKFSLSNFNISHVELGTNKSFWGGAVVNFYYAVGLTENQVTNPENLMLLQPNNGENVSILDVEEMSTSTPFFKINNAETPNGQGLYLDSLQGYHMIKAYKIKVLVLKPTTDIRLIFSNHGTFPVFGDLVFVPG